MWLFFTLLSALLWGAGQVFAKRGIQNITPLCNNLISVIVIVVTWIPFALIHGVQFNQIVGILPITFFVALLFLSFYYVLVHEKISLIGTVVGIYPVLTILLALFFLHENPNIYQKIAIVLTVIGTLLVGMPEKFKTLQQIKIGTWFWLALFVSACLGVGHFLIKVILTTTDLHTYIFTYAICWTVVILLSAIIDKKGRKLPIFTFKTYYPTLLGVAMVESGFLVFHLAASLGPISLVEPISSSYVALTVILAWIFLKERINRTQCIGITLVAIGVILVSIT